MAPQVYSGPLFGGGDYASLLRQKQQTRSNTLRASLFETFGPGLSTERRKALADGQRLVDRFSQELEARQKALEAERALRRTQMAREKEKADQAEAERKLRLAREKMTMLKAKAQAAAAAGDINRAKAIAHAVRDVLREIGHALRLLRGGASGLPSPLATGGGPSQNSGQSGDPSAETRNAAPANPGGEAPVAVPAELAESQLTENELTGGEPATPAPGQTLHEQQQEQEQEKVKAREQERRQEDEQSRTADTAASIADILTGGGGGPIPPDAATAIGMARDTLLILRTIRRKDGDKDGDGIRDGNRTKDGIGRAESPENTHDRLKLQAALHALSAALGTVEAAGLLGIDLRA